MDAGELREKVARAIYDILEGPIANQDFGRQQRQWNKSVMIADAAIVVVLEEAAKVVESEAEYRYGWDEFAKGWSAGTRNAAAVIRNLKGGTDDTR